MIISSSLAYIAQILITVGLTAWVYQTLRVSFQNTICDLEKRLEKSDAKIKSLETEVDKLQKSEDNWYKKYYRLLVIYKTTKCENKMCPINVAIQKHLAEEGEV